MRFDHDKFFAGVKTTWGGLRAAQVAALDSLLNLFEADENMSDIRWIAYALATVKHECADTYSPIAEYGKGKGKAYGKPDPETRQIYYGRGLVQLTWKKNYKLFSEKLGVDLLNEPDAAMELETAYQILSIGMRKGLFTGKSLQNYIHGEVCDYINARRIINGTDRAALIAGYAEQFEEILTSAKVDDAVDAPAIVATTSTTTTTTTPDATVTVTEQKESLIKTLGVPDAAKEIAKSGVTQLGTTAATTLGTVGAGAGLKAFIDGHLTELIFAAFIITLAVVIVIVVLVSKHQTKQKVIEVNADKAKNDVKLL